MKPYKEKKNTELPTEADLREHILLVEEDDRIRCALGFLLQEEGHLVTEARDGAEALRLLLPEHRPTFLVADFELRPMNGGTLAREAVDHGVALRGVILFSSASPADERIQKVRADVGKRVPFSFVRMDKGDPPALLVDGIRRLL